MPTKKDKGKELKVVSVRLTESHSLHSEKALNSPETVAEVVANEFKNYDREVFAVINLNTKLKPININICSIGTLNTALINPREVFKSSILSNAASFIAVHNHPSGDITPSREDIAITKRLIKCGDILDIKMIDHLVIGAGNGKIYSFREEGVFDDLYSEAIKVRENMVLYANKEKTQTLSSCSTLQLREAIPQSFRFDTIIHKRGNIVNDDETMEVKKMSKKNEKENAKVKGSTKKVKENLKEKESKKEQTKENKKDITKEKVNAKEKEKETLEKEIQSLQEQIEDRQLDLYYADSFEQSGQIREDIQEMEAKLSSLEERLKKTVEKASEKENKNIKEKVYLNVHNDFAKVGLESRAGNGQTFNAVTLPKGSIIDGKDMGGGKIYPLDMYIYQNKFNKNLTTVQFKEGQEVQVNFKNGEHVKVKAEDLCKAVTEANKEYLSKNKDIEKSIKKEKDNEMEI